MFKEQAEREAEGKSTMRKRRSRESFSVPGPRLGPSPGSEDAGREG